jgi:hypothetical protein
MFIINEDQDQDKDQDKDEEQELSSRMNLFINFLYSTKFPK